MSDNSLKKGRYTRHSNKIGLYSTSHDRIGFLNNNNDVVLSFPFKDTVLEAGMKKEDTGREERFLHQEVDGADIDTLFEPKVLSNMQILGNNQSNLNMDFFGENGNLQQNLLIKGNNLLALHSLSGRLAGKVKLIYIDPPYNTGNDSFKYNDSFNHSSWLTFMKNRLEIARDLLSDDGSIFVQIDSFEESYLKVLMDEVFGSENFRNKISWKRKGGSSNPSNQLANVVEWILWYSKDSNLMDYTPIYSLDDENTKKYIKERFTNTDEDGRLYMKSPIQSPNYRENLIYDYKGYKTPQKGYSVSRGVMEKWDQEGRLDFPNSKDKNINRKIFLNEYKGQPINSLWTDIYVINPMSTERLEFTSGQKPEALLQRIITMVTKEGDIVLDYHLGSGTTCAVAHKMGRRWIGIEQMDYIEDITKERLKKVIEGEQGGISKVVGWQGGGSFVYFELKKYNQDFLDKIMIANSKGELDEVYNEMAKNAFLKFWFDKNEFEKDENFRSLDLDQRKELLIGILDENQLYLNHADMRDSRYHVTDEEMALTDLFYGVNND